MRVWLVIAIGVGFLLSILPNIYAQENISSPLKQFESGISVQDIKCKDGFVLIIKTNGEPICVKPTSVPRLLSHGWITLEKFETTHPILQQNKTNATSITNETTSDCSKVSDDFKGQQVSELVLTPKVISSSDHVKFLCIGMSPNPPKVGDDVFFGVDVQNISDGPIWIKVGPCFSSLFYTITPEENVQEFPCDNRVKVAVGMGPAAPGVHGVVHAISSHLGGWYKITKPGMLTVTMNFQSIIIDRNLADLNNVTNPYDYNMKAKQDLDKWAPADERVVNDTIQFNINAIDNTTTTKQISTNNTNFVNAPDTNDLASDTSNATGSTILLSPGITTPTISATKPGIKIISITMSPDPLKVGDQPGFTLTWQNISNQTFYNTDDGCGISSLGANITPADHILVTHPTHRLMCAVHSYLVHPGQISTNSAMADPDLAQLNSNGRFLAYYSAYYTIMKPGALNVIMNLYVGNEQGNYELTETIQFNVTATQ